MNRRILFAAFASAALFSKGKGKGKGHGKGHDKANTVTFFTETDRGVITQWARRQSTARLPPGLAKRGGSLPPGLEKQLQRNGRLPPGLDRGSWTPFPQELIVTLPPLPPEYDRGFIGGQAVIVVRNTQIVIDIFKIF